MLIILNIYTILDDYIINAADFLLIVCEIKPIVRNQIDNIKLLF